MKAIKKGNRNRGYIIVLALIALMAMSFFLMTGAMTTSNSVKVSGNYVRTVDTFNIAEVGLARARPMLENVAFSTVLATYASTPLIPETPFNDGTYEVKVSNDEHDPNGASSTTDGNGIIKVTSVGRSGSGGKVTISTYVQLIGDGSVTLPSNPGSCAPATSCNSAGLFCGSTADVKMQGAAAIDGSDRLDDTSPGGTGKGYPRSDCSGSGCNLGGDPSTSSNWDLMAQGNINYDCTGGGSSACTSTPPTMNTNNNTTACSQWQTFYNQWSSVSCTAPGVVCITNDYCGTNDCSDPKIYLINTAQPSIKISGNCYLCGAFIVASNTSIETSGTITLVGAIIMMGPYSNLSYTATTGTSNFYGKVIVRSDTSDAGKELNMKGDANIYYSGDGVGAAVQALNNANAGGGVAGTAFLMTAAWDETY